MGKNSGGVTDWHKQQHKKQLSKNKEARIAARDERVVQEKTVEDIRAEIRKLEHHHKNEQQRPHAIQSKLDRLQKELKLVTAKAEADKKQHELTLQQKKDAQKYETKSNFIPLARPEVSIYYHPVMNPFGAPPPGQPHLYHRRGGGTTSNFCEACSLEEQFLPPPPPPPPRSSQPIERQQPPHRNDSHKSPYRQIESGNSNHLSVSRVASVTKSIATEKPSIDPAILPILPPPSAAVARSKRNKLSSDIWASKEEIQYEEHVSSISLEGIASTVSMHTQWYYKDMADQIQGPYTTDQMRQWNQAGYFPITTLVSGSSNSGPWKVLKDVKQLKDLNSATKVNVPNTKVTSSVQDRIAALRNIQTTHDDDDDVEASVQLRIAALKAAPQQNTFADEGDHCVENILMTPNDQQNSFTPGVIDCRSNLANKTIDSVSHQCNDVTVQSKPSTAQTNDIVVVQIPLPLPPPESENDNLEREHLPLYPIDDDYDVSYPVDDYTTTVDNVDASTSFAEPYLVDFDHGDNAYLENEADLPVTGDYDNAIHEYSIQSNDDISGTGLFDDRHLLKDSGKTEQPKKRIKIDDAVVALVPSRVRKRY